MKCIVEVCKFTYGLQAASVKGQVPSEHWTLVVRARPVGAEGTCDTHRLNLYHYVMLGRVWMQALHVLEQGWVTIKEVRLGSKGWHRCGVRRVDIHIHTHAHAQTHTRTHTHTHTHTNTHTPGFCVTPMYIRPSGHQEPYMPFRL